MISFGLSRVSALGRQTRFRLAAARSVVAFGTSAALFPAAHNALVSVGRSLIYKFRRFYNIGRTSEPAESLRTNSRRALEGHDPRVREDIGALALFVGKAMSHLSCRTHGMGSFEASDYSNFVPTVGTSDSAF